jgi:hypothetical protein
MGASEYVEANPKGSKGKRVRERRRRRHEYLILTVDI